MIKDRRAPSAISPQGVVIVPARVPRRLFTALLVMFVSLVLLASVGGFVLEGQASKARHAAEVAQAAVERQRVIEEQLIKNCSAANDQAVKFNAALDALVQTPGLTGLQRETRIQQFAGVHQTVNPCPKIEVP